MSRSSLVVICVFAGCNTGQTSVIVQSAQLTPAAELIDLGDVVVDGEPEPFVVTIVHTAGVGATIGSVTVQNLDGTYFAYTGEVPFEVPIDATVELPFDYLPDAPGFHRAQVTIVSDAVNDEIGLDVRAHGVVGEPEVWPRVLDFGLVGANGTGELAFTLANAGAAELVLFGGDVTGGGTFSIDADLPLVIAGGTSAQVPVSIVADTSEAITASLVLDLGAATAPVLTLRANDCANGSPSAYDVDRDGVSVCAGDCDDDEGRVRPGAIEATDGLDNDCDGLIDDGTLVFDDDGDCVCEAASCVGSIDATCATIDGGDCGDADADVYPGADEVLGDGVDGDCDGLVDSGSSDVDGDGYAPEGGDCDDLAEDVFPGAAEAANGADDDCDGKVDENTAAYDDDGDGKTENQGDCDDGDALIAPGAAERPNWRDDDCDGDIDDGTANFDDDGDGFTETGGDCKDTDPNRNPGVAEVVGNGIDEDCNATTGP